MSKCGPPPVAEIHVVIPARDEELRLRSCLLSVRRAARQLSRTWPAVAVSTLVVLDSCVDGTAEVAAALGVPAVPVQVGRVGAARAAGVEHAVRGSTADLSRVWIASTDADTVVPPQWLTAQVELAGQGWDVVLGTVEPQPQDLGRPGVERWRATYTAGEGHPHVHGANLGLTLAAYRAAGGWPTVALHEDVRLVRAARAAGARTCSTDRTRVRTSGRLRGRVVGGFSGFLAALERREEGP